MEANGRTQRTSLPADKRIVLTGIGVVAPNGIGNDAWWKATTAGKTGIAPITRFETDKYAVKLADWIINNLLEEELGLVEVELSENYRLTYGWVVLYVQWVVELSLRYEKPRSAAPSMRSLPIFAGKPTWLVRSATSFTGPPSFPRRRRCYDWPLGARRNCCSTGAGRARRRRRHSGIVSGSRTCAPRSRMSFADSRRGCCQRPWIASKPAVAASRSCSGRPPLTPIAPISRPAAITSTEPSPGTRGRRLRAEAAVKNPGRFSKLSASTSPGRPMTAAPAALASASSGLSAGAPSMRLSKIR